MASPRRIGMKIMLLGVSLGLCFLLLEIGVLLVMGEQPKFPRHVVGTDFGVRVNEPGARYRHKSADGVFWFEINSRGLRADRDHPYEKPEGVFRIVSLGDSFTAGYEVQGDETFSAVLERALRSAGLRVEVLNAGVSGYSNAEAAVYLERELLRYEPDLVLLSFYANDLVDNVRSGLFEVVDGQLVQKADRYVPGGALGDLLNTNPIFNTLSGYSNAFVFLKERLTYIAKRSMVAENQANLADAADAADSDRLSTDTPATPSLEGTERQRILAAANLDRIYETARSRDIPFVIQSIPHFAASGEARLLEMFPLEEFDVDRPDLYFVGLIDLLSRALGKQALYNRRSPGHWTAFSHRRSGEALAALILAQGVLDANDCPGTRSLPHPSC